MKLAVCAIALVMIPVVSLGNTCLLEDAIQHQEWQPEPGSVFPNSLCIFPDGRTGLDDAKFDVTMVFGSLYQQYGEPVGCDWNFLGKGIDFGWSGPGVVLCTGGAVFAPCQSLPCGLNWYNISGGGHTPVDENGQPYGIVQVIWVPDCPSGCDQKYVELFINSPDINGDLMINLSDIGIFSSDLNGDYNYRSDFNFDGVVNLSDNGILASAMGSACQ